MRQTFSTSGIMIRRTDFGEADLITTFLTSDMGKVAAIAKYARRSKKRFAGILELFSLLRVVCSQGRGLPILQEASLEQPFANIRTDIRKTAYASYWAELISAWTEEGETQDQLYHLLRYVLETLDAGTVPAEVLSILFQMRLMSLSGFSPNLSHCGVCGVRTDQMEKNRLIFGLARGELVCEKCASGGKARAYLSKGTVKQLLWVESGELRKAARVRFSAQSLREGLTFLEAFVPHHLGKTPRSLAFLQQIRKEF